MTDSAIRVQNIAKRYQLGVTHSGSIRELSNRAFSALLRRSPRKEPSNSGNREFWALKDINFDVSPGDVVGVIGKNGAGKSTLLKILSNITSPTKGRVEMRGRVASLLEVGTGFHPELTGRENIFMNGTILGMSKREISKQFDAIVDFSGIEGFIDTPVKRYSSGMTVRLGFAIAAHLQPEILIVDEVLAVGDMDFQRKCLGKMNEVAASGRTVLFVSHNMSSVAQLCTKGLLIEDGIASGLTPIRDAMIAYLGNTNNDNGSKDLHSSVPDKSAILRIVINQEGLADKPCVLHDRPIDVDFQLQIKKCHWNRLRLSVAVCDKQLRKVFTSMHDLQVSEDNALAATMSIPGRSLMPGEYSFIAGLLGPNGEDIDVHRYVANFRIEDAGDSMNLNPAYDYGVVFVDCKWSENVNG